MIPEMLIDVLTLMDPVKTEVRRDENAKVLEHEFSKALTVMEAMSAIGPTDFSRKEAL